LRLNPPRLGEHTDSLLAEVGYTSAQILAMKKTLIAKADQREAGVTSMSTAVPTSLPPH
jgi:hypothetical protein